MQLSFGTLCMLTGIPPNLTKNTGTTKSLSVIPTVLMLTIVRFLVKESKLVRYELCLAFIYDLYKHRPLHGRICCGKWFRMVLSVPDAVTFIHLCHVAGKSCMQCNIYWTRSSYFLSVFISTCVIKAGGHFRYRLNFMCHGSSDEIICLSYRNV